jgi:hypothetical protein
MKRGVEPWCICAAWTKEGMTQIHGAGLAGSQRLRTIDQLGPHPIQLTMRYARLAGRCENPRDVEVIARTPPSLSDKLIERRMKHGSVRRFPERLAAATARGLGLIASDAACQDMALQEDCSHGFDVGDWQQELFVMVDAAVAGVESWQRRL